MTTTHQSLGVFVGCSLVPSEDGSRPTTKMLQYRVVSCRVAPLCAAFYFMMKLICMKREDFSDTFRQIMQLFPRFCFANSIKLKLKRNTNYNTRLFNTTCPCPTCPCPSTCPCVSSKLTYGLSNVLTTLSRSRNKHTLSQLSSL